MATHPVFNVIDLENWPRKFYFEHYSKNVKCTYSVTANVNIESLLAICKEKSVKLYPAMIHIITTAVNRIENLRIGYNEENQLGMWSFMSPSYTVFHHDDKIFSNIWTTYEEDFLNFNHNYLEDNKRYGDIKDFFAKEKQPENTFPISCIPWIDFTGFNLNIYDDAEYLLPIFTIGKYTKKEGRTMIPISVQLHHATCDGYHVGLLFEEIRSLTLNFKLNYF